MKYAFSFVLVFTALSMRPARASDGAESSYSFREMNCTGTLAAGSNLSDDWKRIAIQVESSPHQITDILGQKRTFALSWRYSFGKTLADAQQALTSASDGGVRFDSPELTQRAMGDRTIVSYTDHYYQEEYLHLVRQSSGTSEDSLRGTFTDPASSPSSPENYEVECTATK